MSVATEAARQQALLRALWSGEDGAVCSTLHERGTRAAQGLAAYRANAGALAERALAAVFPTVQAMLGERDFKHLARDVWQAHPPLRGDMGEWGDTLPAWLQAHPAFSEWPYLPDSARLDLAVHRCERAADAALDADSLGLLSSGEPAGLCVALMPGTAVLSSRWPVGTIYLAHQQREAGADADFGPVREALQQQRGEHVVVARAGWRAQVRIVDAATGAWMGSMLAAMSLGTALERCGEGFDFAAWLVLALREGWLHAVLPDGRAAMMPAAQSDP